MPVWKQARSSSSSEVAGTIEVLGLQLARLPYLQSKSLIMFAHFSNFVSERMFIELSIKQLV